jgi:CRISPR/Cas system-associated endoribonuclease Cas2
MIYVEAVATPVAADKNCHCLKEYVNRLKYSTFKCTPSTPLLTDLVSGLPYHSEQLREMAKGLMRSAGIDTIRFTAYSLKAAGLSRRAAEGESTSQLEDAARLSHKSHTLQRHYLRTVTKH